MLLRFHKLNSEAGSSLIWFINFTGLLIVLVLVMVSSVDQFVRLSQYQDFLEEYALSVKALTNLNDTIEQAQMKLNSSLGDTTDGLSANWMQDGVTVEVNGCLDWKAPLISLSQQYCLSAKAR